MLVVDDKLTWSEHVKSFSQKIMPMIPILYKCGDYLTNKTKKIVYNAYFLSLFRYLLPVWGVCGRTLIESMQVLQNKIIKILYGFDRVTSTESLYQTLGMNKINDIIILEQCKLTYKIIHKQQKSNTQILFTNEIHNYTRTQHDIYQRQIHSNIGLYNPMSKASASFNTLPTNRNKAH